MAAYERSGSRVTGVSVQYLVCSARSPPVGFLVVECERMIQAAGSRSLPWEALGNSALTAALNQAAMSSRELVMWPPSTVYGTGWRDFEWYYSTDAAMQGRELEEAQVATLIVLYGKQMYSRPREPAGSLLSHLFTRAGEPTK